MNGWHSDKVWSDKFLRQIKGIIGQELICAAPDVEDQEHNTDLIVFKLDAIRIACRVRRFAYQRYAGEFTLRSNRLSGMKTELAKVIEGWGNYIFYGYANQDDTAIEKWLIGDLSRFRLWFNSQIVNNKGKIPGMDKANSDGSSDFRVFNAAAIPRFVLATDIAHLLDATKNHHGINGKPQPVLEGTEEWLVDYNKALASQSGARL